MCAKIIRIILSQLATIKSLILVEAFIRIIQHKRVLTAGGDLNGCSTRLGSEGEEEEGEEDEGEEVPGALPPAASLLSLRVRHCSLSHQTPTRPQTLAQVRASRSGRRTLEEQATFSLFQYVFGPSGLLSCFRSGPCPPAGLLYRL